MPLIIPDDLSTRWVLEADGVFLIDRAGAIHQDCRPLKVLVVDLDAGNTAAVDGILGLLALSPIQVEPVLATLGGAPASLSAITNSVPWSERWPDQFDAVILSDRPDDGGHPQQSPAWDEVRDLLDWSGEHARSLLPVGWSAFAALAHRHGVEATQPARSVHNRVAHRVTRRQSYLLRGIDDDFTVQVRWQRTLPRRFLLDVPGLDTVATSVDGEPYLLRTHDRRTVYCLHHPLEGLGAPTGPRGGGAHAALLFANWINYYLYQPISQATPAIPR
jgi:homoserine O-succinyltransferase